MRAWIVVWIASAAATLPVWLARVPPLVDYPQHLALASVLANWNDPRLAYPEHFEVSLFHPNSAFELTVAALSQLVPIEVAGKLVLSLALVAVGPAALALVRRAGRPDSYALLAVSASLGYSFWFGFVGTMLAAPALLVALALADRVLEAPTRRDLAGFAALSFLLYVTHLLFLAVFAGLALVLCLSKRAPLARLAPIGPAFLAGLAYVLFWRGEAISLYDRASNAAPLDFVSPLARLALLPGQLFGFHRGLEAISIALGGIALAFAVIPPASHAPSRFTRLALLAAGAYFLSPANIVGTNVYQRFGATALMLGAAALPTPGGRREKAVVIALGALAAAEIGLASRAALAIRREGDGLHELLARTEPGRLAAALVVERESAALVAPEVYRHQPALYQAVVGGRMVFSFASIHHSMVRWRDGKEPDGELALVTDLHPADFDWSRRVDYVFTRGVEPPPDLGCEVTAAGRWKLVACPPTGK